MYQHNFHSHSQTTWLVDVHLHFTQICSNVFIQEECTIAKTKSMTFAGPLSTLDSFVCGGFCCFWVVGFCLLGFFVLFSLVGLGFFSPFEYVSLMKIYLGILCLRDVCWLFFKFIFPIQFYRKCGVFLTILLFVGRFTWCLSNSSSRSYRDKLLGIWTTMDVFINLNLSKGNVLPKLCFFASCLCQVSSRSSSLFNLHLFWKKNPTIICSVGRKGYITEVRLLSFSFYGASH